ncbi:GNAT family N-acetyltransferase [Altererythrobacter indicus]|uniref:GNAT family N-acetyltransferase n=1 Tax=Altericroceibacterium indicum TaxID=374177 RepID=A0A845ACG2_9SPHN|nr:GNAT family N-acetyltransferase [Altericroceibacterium indicum]MXP24868.1 GNAT family N-acetyltransferase [Altericroceibacterium indicum]
MSQALLTSRMATMADVPALSELMQLSIATLQKGFLTEEQIGASRAVMGLDTQLVRDGTYFMIEEQGRLAGCGGWSRRATLYGGDHSTSLRDPELLDPAKDAARVRAMYTHPNFARRGVGRLILSLCEAAAIQDGFARAEMMATLSGKPLYVACGYTPIETIEADVDGIKVPLVRMGKVLEATKASV